MDGLELRQHRAARRELVAPCRLRRAEQAAEARRRDRARRRQPEPLRWLMESDVCKHCTHAGCLDACPTGALFRTEFGTVVVQEDVCNGCGYCVPACPFGVIDRRDLPRSADDAPLSLPMLGRKEDGRVWKCTLCYDRLKGGHEPACAKACPTDSIQFGELAFDAVFGSPICDHFVDLFLDVARASVCSLSLPIGAVVSNLRGHGAARTATGASSHPARSLPCCRYDLTREATRRASARNAGRGYEPTPANPMAIQEAVSRIEASCGRAGACRSIEAATASPLRHAARVALHPDVECWPGGYLHAGSTDAASPGPREVACVVAGLSLSGISLLFTIGLPYLWRKPMRRMIREELKSMGIHICVHCGYSLTGNVSGVCPECGERI